VTVLDFSMELTSDRDKLMKYIIDFENYPKILPEQLKSLEILENVDNQISTKEEIFFSTIIKKPFEQKSVHTIIMPNKLETEIISGPAKGTKLYILLDKLDSGTAVKIEIDLKLGLKAIVLQPLIKKWYKRVIKALLLKINNIVNNSA
tara:strand:+ start:90 stop:533 length:444 start_codon:yes stop_codon:yes gene_type:complete